MEIALTIFELGGLTVASYFFFSLQAKKYKMTDLVEFINKATVFNPELLKKILSGKAPRTYLESLRDFEEGKDYARGLAFVQGIVDSKTPILSRLNKNTKLIFSSISTQSLFSNNQDLKFKKSSKSNLSVGNFSLKDSNYGVSEIIPLSLLDKITGFGNIFSESTLTQKLSDFEINPTELLNKIKSEIEIPKNEKVPSIEISLNPSNLKTQISPALGLIHSTTSTRVLTSIETLMSYLIKALKFFLSVSSISKKIQGFKIGFKKIERGIKLGQFIVAFGEVFYDRKTQQLKMENPICLLKNKSQMLKKLKVKKLMLSRKIRCAFIFMTLMGFLVVRRSTKICKSIFQRMRRMKELKKMDKLFKLSQIINEDYKCIICYDLAKHVIFKPCLHMACCRICYEKLEKKKCILCKEDIEDVVTIYVK